MAAPDAGQELSVSKQQSTVTERNMQVAYLKHKRRTHEDKIMQDIFIRVITGRCNYRIMAYLNHIITLRNTLVGLFR